jgi:hypothetical protein
VGVQAEVCAVVIEAGRQLTVTPVTEFAAATTTVAKPDLVVSCVEVAVMVAVPAAVGVNTPLLPTVPMFVGLTDHVTVEL